MTVEYSSSAEDPTQCQATELPGKLCSLATITLSSILAVDLCYPYVTMLVSRSYIYVYHAASYSLIPTSYYLVACLPVGLASRRCMFRSVVASLSLFCITCLV